MQDRVLRRAAVAAAALTLVVAGIVAADSLSADADQVQPGVQGDVHLGTFGPGATVTIDVPFTLACTGFNHVDAGQSIVLTQGPATIPDGTTASATSVTLSPPPAGWPDDGADCSSAPEPVTPPQTSRVTLTTPTADGDDYAYLITWSRSLSPSGSLDSRAFSGMTSVTFRLDVVSNTPPVLTAPGDMTVEGNALGGWTGAWSVAATDAEDDPDPDPRCAPASGSLLPLGTTTVDCLVEDSGGLQDAGSFRVTVTDTTPPVLSAVPVDQSVLTADPAGAIVSWPAPTATDIVAGSVGVACAPASGSLLPVGQTTVTCSAADGNGNAAQASFLVTVELDAPEPATVSVSWGAPVGTAGVVVGNPGRTLPLKATVSLDGVLVGADGPAPRIVLDRLASCGGAVIERRDGAMLTWASDGWRHNLETTALAGACWRVSLAVGDGEGGAFELDLQSPGAASQKQAKPTESSAAAPSPAPAASAAPSSEPSAAPTVDPPASDPPSDSSPQPSAAQASDAPPSDGAAPGASAEG